MYPLVDCPDYTEAFETFDELKRATVNLSGLNFPLSWWLFGGDETSELPSFSLCIFMPRLGKTTVWVTHNFDAVAVRQWVATDVRTMIEDWYDWETLSTPTKLEEQ